MNSSVFYPSFLILHLVGLTLMAGTTIIDFVGHHTYWKMQQHDQARAAGVLQLLSKFSRFIGIGAALLIFTGIGMMAVTHGVFGEQTWFRVKFGIVIVLIANSLFIGRRQALKLRKLVDDHPADLIQKIAQVRINLNRFYILQLILFFSIIFLSVFKFN